ncbi:MAG: hypothetical protein NW218_01390 [Saprospiraceae bacterium]|nr:hypothetical protein [Saprospiraceae bacterium]
MTLRRKSPESALDRLEREGNDDFNLLNELGPGHFGVEHLLELREKSYQRLDRFQRRQKLAMMVGASAAVWIMMAFLSKVLNFIWLAFAAFGLGSLSLIAFLGLILLQQKQFGTKGELDYTQRMIEEELRRRAGKMPQNPRPKQ